MAVYRVMWIDAAGEGRFTSIKAPSAEAAVWKAAVASDSSVAEFAGVLCMDAPAARSMMGLDWREADLAGGQAS